MIMNSRAAGDIDNGEVGSVVWSVSGMEEIRLPKRVNCRLERQPGIPLEFRQPYFSKSGRL